MSDWKESILDNLVEVDPEQLTSSTENDFSFFYIDISSVCSGIINYPIHPITYGAAPSRARKILRYNDILMSSVRPNLKAFAHFKRISRLNFIASTGFSILRANPNTDIDFIFHSLFSNEIEKQIDTLVVGSNYPAINSSDVRKLKIKVPTLPEQRRIAQILTTTDVVIEKTQAAIAKYKAIKQGMLHDLFTRGIDPTSTGSVAGKLRPTYHDAPDLYKESKLGWIPKKWDCDKLEKMCEINPHANLPITLKPNDEVSFFKMEDVSNDAEILNQNTREIIDVFKKGFTPFIENDILFAKITPCMENGKGALANKLKNGFGFGSTEFHVIRARDEKSIQFLFYLTTSNAFRLNAEGKMSGSAGQQRVPTSFLQDFQIAIPPIDEQFEIGLRIDSCNSKIKSEQAYLQKLQQIKKGLMEDLLSGKKRVTVSEVEHR